MVNKLRVDARFPECIRSLLKKTNISTANGRAKVEHGVRIWSGPWDIQSDAIMMNNSPNLTSV